MRLKNLFLLLCKVGLGGRRTKEWFLGKPAKIKLFLGLSNMRMWISEYSMGLFQIYIHSVYSNYSHYQIRYENSQQKIKSTYLVRGERGGGYGWVVHEDITLLYFFGAPLLNRRLVAGQSRASFSQRCLSSANGWNSRGWFLWWLFFIEWFVHSWSNMLKVGFVWINGRQEDKGSPFLKSGQFKQALPK